MQIFHSGIQMHPHHSAQTPSKQSSLKGARKTEFKSVKHFSANTALFHIPYFLQCDGTNINLFHIIPNTII